MLARMNRPEAASSCAPGSWIGECGLRNQISRGTLAIRLIVMEFGRFMALGAAPADHCASWNHSDTSPIGVVFRA